MTPEEVRASEEKVARYNQSAKLVDRVAAVLMDTAVAASGAPEGEALSKAEAILRLEREGRLRDAEV